MAFHERRLADENTVWTGNCGDDLKIRERFLGGGTLTNGQKERMLLEQSREGWYPGTRQDFNSSASVKGFNFNK